MFNNFDNGFGQAQQEYERRLFAPYDDLPLTEEEIDEIEDAKADIGERMMEERWLKERGL